MHKHHVPAEGNVLMLWLLYVNVSIIIPPICGEYVGLTLIHVEGELGEGGLCAVSPIDAP